MHFKKVIHKGTLSLLVALHANGFTLPTQSVIEPSKIVDFPTTLERALQNDPYQEWVDHRIEGIQGDHLQASKRPNPVIGIEIGNLLGSGSYRRTESSEVTLSLSQVIETAGKRNLRVQQAAASQNELLWERAHQRLQKEAQVRAAFIEARIAQDTLKLRHQQLKVAQASAQETARLANEARVPSVDIQTAAIEAACRRVRPVLITALTSGLRLLPLLLAKDTGSEIQRPLAMVVAGGLVSSTLLTLLVIPALYQWFERTPKDPSNSSEF